MILKLTVTSSSRFIWGGILCKYQRMDDALYFGRYSEEKGIGTLIKVCKELCGDYSENCKDISFDTVDEYYEKIMRVYQ